jgi:hypothetical protein
MSVYLQFDGEYRGKRLQILYFSIKHSQVDEISEKKVVVTLVYFVAGGSCPFSSCCRHSSELREDSKDQLSVKRLAPSANSQRETGVAIPVPADR